MAFLTPPLLVAVPTERRLLRGGVALDPLLGVQDDLAVIALEALRMPVLVQGREALGGGLARLGGDGLAAARASRRVLLVVACLAEKGVVFVCGEAYVWGSKIRLADATGKAGSVEGNPDRANDLTPDVLLADVAAELAIWVTVLFLVAI